MSKKKKLRMFFVLCLALTMTACGQVTTKVKVVDEEGNPIEEAEVRIRYLGYKDEENKILKTNENGFAKDVGKPELRLHVYVNKEGYYQTLTGGLDRTKDHDLEIVLKKRINPIPLYARKIKIISPAVGQKLGYDFELGDWVAPFGKGKSSDVFFEVHYEEKERHDYDYRFNVSFPNDLDGLREFRDSRLSKLQSDHDAPNDGYLSTWKQEMQRRPGHGRRGNRDQLRNFWMRVRSKVDDQGELVSAHYMKIYGDFPEFTYYFNSVANDRNLEFDPERNLFENLPRKEKVTQP